MKNDQYLKSVTNALRVLEALGDSWQEPVGLSDLARELGLGKSTCHRLLTTLESRDFVRQEQSTGKYRLGSRTICIAGRYIESMEVRNASKPILEELVNKTGETAHIAVLDRDAALFIAKVDSDNPFRMMSYIGWRAPLHCCALGKVLLAYNTDQSLIESIDLVRYAPNTIVDLSTLRIELDRIKTRGWAIDDEEAQLGLRCYAAPVRNFEGEVIAAVSVSGPKVRSNPKNKEYVVRAAKELSYRMGYSGNKSQQPTRMLRTTL